MNEQQCLEGLQGLTEELKHAWQGQIRHNLLQTACRESIQDGSGSTRLNPWITALARDRSPTARTWDVIAKDFGAHHVLAARGFLACAQLVWKALAIFGQKPACPQPSPAELSDLWHDACAIVEYPCNCANDHGLLAFSQLAEDLRQEKPPMASPAAYALDTIFHSLGSKPLSLKPPVTASWLWEVSRWLLGEPRQSVWTVNASIAVIENRNGVEAGMILTLVLDLLEPGTGQLFHHPDDVFLTSLEAEFFSSMQAAWNMARPSAEHPGKDGRFRVFRDGQPIPRVSGPSAGGAAVREWGLAWRGKKSDPRVIVIAQVDHLNQLGGFQGAGIAAKTQAVIDNSSYDTIVVASADDQAVAESQIKKTTAEIRVINIDNDLDPV